MCVCIDMCLCVYVNLYACVYVYISIVYICSCMYTYVYLCDHVHMCLCVYECICVCLCIYVYECIICICMHECVCVHVWQSLPFLTHVCVHTLLEDKVHARLIHSVSACFWSGAPQRLLWSVKLRKAKPTGTTVGTKVRDCAWDQQAFPCSLWVVTLPLWLLPVEHRLPLAHPTAHSTHSSAQRIQGIWWGADPDLEAVAGFWCTLSLSP